MGTLAYEGERGIPYSPLYRVLLDHVVLSLADSLPTKLRFSESRVAAELSACTFFFLGPLMLVRFVIKALIPKASTIIKSLDFSPRAWCLRAGDNSCARLRVLLAFGPVGNIRDYS